MFGMNSWQIDIYCFRHDSIVLTVSLKLPSEIIITQWLRDRLDDHVALTLRDCLLFGGRVPAEAHASETGTDCLRT